ncbi:MAG: hypothetical protein KatS3mg032_2416 [Cyclobacteriaceae bacterium]|nr:MAG: hypothetical protein KatS3mg032_2416 [Cyclobacteriaceae bacterium]
MRYPILPGLRALDSKSHLFVDDPVSGNLILVDDEGKLIKQINRKGNEPDSYSEITAFQISNDKAITVYDFQRQNFLYFSPAGGSLTTRKMPYNFRNFIFYKDYLFLFTAKHRNVVNHQTLSYDVLIVKNDTLVDHYFRFNPDHYTGLRIHTQKPFFKWREGIIFSDIFRDTIYYFESRLPRPVYRFVYRNKPLPSGYYENGHEELLQKMLHDKHTIKPYDFGAYVIGINDRVILYNYIHNGTKYFSVFNLRDRSSRNFTFNTDDADINRLLMPFYSCGDEFVTVVPKYVIEKVLDNSNHNKIDGLRLKLQYLQDAEHPVIVKYAF